MSLRSINNTQMSCSVYNCSKNGNLSDRFNNATNLTLYPTIQMYGTSNLTEPFVECSSGDYSHSFPINFVHSLLKLSISHDDATLSSFFSTDLLSIQWKHRNRRSSKTLDGDMNPNTYSVHGWLYFNPSCTFIASLKYLFGSRLFMKRINSISQVLKGFFANNWNPRDRVKSGQVFNFRTSGMDRLLLSPNMLYVNTSSYCSGFFWIWLLCFALDCTWTAWSHSSRCLQTSKSPEGHSVGWSMCEMQKTENFFDSQFYKRMECRMKFQQNGVKMSWKELKVYVKWNERKINVISHVRKGVFCVHCFKEFLNHYES